MRVGSHDEDPPRRTNLTLLGQAGKGGNGSRVEWSALIKAFERREKDACSVAHSNIHLFTLLHTHIHAQ